MARRERKRPEPLSSNGAVSVNQISAIQEQVQTKLYTPIINEIEIAKSQLPNISREHLGRLDNRSLQNIMRINIFQQANWQLPEHVTNEYSTTVKEIGAVRNQIVDSFIKNDSPLDEEMLINTVVCDLESQHNSILQKNEVALKQNLESIRVFYDNILTRAKVHMSNSSNTIAEYRKSNSDDWEQYSTYIKNANEQIKYLNELLTDGPKKAAATASYADETLESKEGIFMRMKKSTGALSVLASVFAFIVNLVLFIYVVVDMSLNHMLFNVMFVVFFSAIFAIMPYFTSWAVQQGKENLKREHYILLGFVAVAALYYTVLSISSSDTFADGLQGLSVAIFFGLIPFLMSLIIHTLQHRHFIRSEPRLVDLEVDQETSLGTNLEAIMETTEISPVSEPEIHSAIELEISPEIVPEDIPIFEPEDCLAAEPENCLEEMELPEVLKPKRPTPESLAGTGNVEDFLCISK